MELFHKILKIAIDGAASDIHIKIGTPVIFRINRELIAVECPFPTAEWMNKVVANHHADSSEKTAGRGARG